MWATVTPVAGGGFALDLDEPVEGVAPGQAAVLYDGRCCRRRRDDRIGCGPVAVQLILLATASDAWQYALAVFLILTAIGLVIVLLRFSGTLQRINTALDGVVAEVVPMLGKVSVSLDHVNDELEKVGHITDSAVDATDKVDSAVRAVSDAVQKPAQGRGRVHRRRVARVRDVPRQARPARRRSVRRLLLDRRGGVGRRRPLPARPGDRRAGGAALADVVTDLPRRLWHDLETIPDDLRAAAEEGAAAAQRSADSVDAVG